MRIKGNAGNRNSAAKLLCPSVEPGPIIVGRVITFCPYTSSSPITLNDVAIITTENDTVLKKFSSPKAAKTKIVRRIMLKGVIRLESCRINKDSEPFINDVRNVNGNNKIK